MQVSTIARPTSCSARRCSRGCARSTCRRTSPWPIASACAPHSATASCASGDLEAHAAGRAGTAIGAGHAGRALRAAAAGRASVIVDDRVAVGVGVAALRPAAATGAAAPAATTASTGAAGAAPAADLAAQRGLQRGARAVTARELHGHVPAIAAGTAIATVPAITTIAAIAALAAARAVATGHAVAAGGAAAALRADAIADEVGLLDDREVVAATDVDVEPRARTAHVAGADREVGTLGTGVSADHEVLGPLDPQVPRERRDGRTGDRDRDLERLAIRDRHEVGDRDLIDDVADRAGVELAQLAIARDVLARDARRWIEHLLVRAYRDRARDAGDLDLEHTAQRQLGHDRDLGSGVLADARRRLLPDVLAHDHVAADDLAIVEERALDRMLGERDRVVPFRHQPLFECGTGLANLGDRRQRDVDPRDPPPRIVPHLRLWHPLAEPLQRGLVAGVRELVEEGAIHGAAVPGAALELGGVEQLAGKPDPDRAELALRAPLPRIRQECRVCCRV